MFNSYADLVDAYNKGEIDLKTSIYHETLKVASHFNWKAGLIGAASLFVEIIYLLYCLVTGAFVNLLVLVPFHIGTIVLRKPTFVNFPLLKTITIVLICALAYFYFTSKTTIFGLTSLAIGLSWVLNIVWYSYSDYVVKKLSLSDEKLFCNLFSYNVIGLYNHSSGQLVTGTDFKTNG